MLMKSGGWMPLQIWDSTVVRSSEFSHSETPERAHLGRIQLHCSASCTLDASKLPYISYLGQQLFKIKLMVLLQSRNCSSERAFQDPANHLKAVNSSPCILGENTLLSGSAKSWKVRFSWWCFISEAASKLLYSTHSHCGWVRHWD